MATLLDRPATAPQPGATGQAAGVASRARGVGLFVALTALYFAAGYLLVMRYNLFEGDFASRVANAGYVIMSRDRHLSAIGFVWNPLPSLVEIPILLFTPIWPDLRTHGLAGVLQSAVFMAGSVMVVRGIAVDRGVSTGWRRIALVGFAFQPMIILYGGAGMSEAAETACLLWCARHLMRWADQRRTQALAWAGIALGAGYLARYEVVPAAVGICAFVAVLSARLAADKSRFTAAAANVVIVMFPIATAAGIWALSSWVINHELFAAFSSQYSNKRQVADAIARHGMVRDSPTAWVVISARLLGMQPFAGIAAAAAVAYGLIARKPVTLAPVVVFGPVIVFAAWGQYTATTFGLFRYFILAIPLVTCIALAVWAPAETSTGSGSLQTRANRYAAALLCASIVVGFPVTVRAMLNRGIANFPLQAGFASLLDPRGYPPQEIPERQMMVADRVMAAYLDLLQLPDGAVLMDSAYAWGPWLSSAHPTQFVVNSDYDFKAALNRPWVHQVKYFLVSNPANTDADAINVRYPTLWNDGAGFSRLVYTVYGPTGGEYFRLFEITGPQRPERGTG